MTIDDRPKLVEFPDFYKVIELVEGSLRAVSESGAEFPPDDDFQHYVYEEVMEALYGKTYWNWVNNYEDLAEY